MIDIHIIRIMIPTHQTAHQIPAYIMRYQESFAIWGIKMSIGSSFDGVIFYQYITYMYHLHMTAVTNVKQSWTQCFRQSLVHAWSIMHSSSRYWLWSRPESMPGLSREISLRWMSLDITGDIVNIGSGNCLMTSSWWRCLLKLIFGVSYKQRLAFLSCYR